MRARLREEDGRAERKKNTTGEHKFSSNIRISPTNINSECNNKNANMINSVVDNAQRCLRRIKYKWIM